MPNPFKNLFKGKDKSEVKLESAGQAVQDSNSLNNNPINEEEDSTLNPKATSTTTTITDPQTGTSADTGTPQQTDQSSLPNPTIQSSTTSKKEQSVSTTPNKQPSALKGETGATPPSGEPGSQTAKQPDGDVTQQTAQAKGDQPTKDKTVGSIGTIDRTKRSGIDVLTRLTARSNQAMMAGVEKAKELKVQYIDTQHALWGLLADPGIYQLISELKVTPTDIQADLESVFKKGNNISNPQFSPRVKRALELSLSAARSLGYEFISPEHILLALAQEGEGAAAKILAKHGLTVEVLNKKITGKEKINKEPEKKQRSAIEQYTHDLTQSAKEGRLDPVVARSAEIERIMHILSRRTKNNPVLIGEAGVGKTAIVEGLAQRIAAGNVPETLKNKRILSVDLMSLIAGASARGDFEERLKNLIREVKSAGGEIILFIDEIHNMVGAGGGGSSGAMDASNILKPSLARGELQTIGATTITEYRKHMEKDRALERRFQPIVVDEPTPQQAIEMLTALRDKYESFHKVSIPDEAIKAAVHLSHRYIGDRFLPDKAVDLIDEAASSVRLPAISLPEEIKSLEDRKKLLEEEKLEAQKIQDDVRVSSIERQLEKLDKQLKEKQKAFELKKSTTTNQVSPEIIQEIVSRWTNIPLSRLTESESSKLLKLEDLLHKRIIDQKQAVDAVAEAVRRGRAGLKSSKRPIGSFIFMGPTGVGKTELAKALAEILFGSEEKIVRLDMTEYMEKHEVAKLIGAPPGYVGYEEGGQLTEAVRRKPYSVVLMDEIEKAHMDVFNILLQILDDGRLTDNKGRTIDFKNTILICTSNIGTGLIQKEMLTETKFVFDTQVLSTLVYSPTGRALITSGKRLWQKDKQADSWTTLVLEDYFKGQNVENADVLTLKQQFPTAGFDSHAIAPSGEELITAGGRLWKRSSTTAKTWKTLSLIDYFKKQEVINAALDQPEQQLPTAKIDTIAISPSETQIVTFKGRFWIRSGLTSNRWQTGTLKDYLKDSTVTTLNQSARIPSNKPKETNFPQNQSVSTQQVNPQTAASVGQASKSVQPDSSKKKVLPGTAAGAPRLSSGMAAAAEPDPQLLKKVKELMGPKSQSQNTPENKAGQVAGHLIAKPQTNKLSNSSASFENKYPIPTDKWDLHLFAPSGEEIIIRGKRFWKRSKFDDKIWSTGSLDQLVTTTHVANADPNNIKHQLPIGQKTDKAEREKQAVEEAKFAQLKEKLLDELRKFFKPELLNRFDDTLVFKPLAPKDLLKIVDLQFKELTKLLEEQSVGLEVTEAAKQEIAIEGYDPIFGARPLRRTLQKMVENPISSMIIKGELKATDIVLVDFDGNDFIFTAKVHPKRWKTEQKAKEKSESSKQTDKAKKETEQTEETPSKTSGVLRSESPEVETQVDEKPSKEQSLEQKEGGIKVEMMQTDTSPAEPGSQEPKQTASAGSPLTKPPIKSDADQDQFSNTETLTATGQAQQTQPFPVPSKTPWS